jgi:hypothetical protein
VWGSQPQITLSSNRFSHPLGPALNVRVCDPTNPNTAYFAQGAFIFPEDTPTRREVAISVVYAGTANHFQRIQPLLKEMINRIRFVERPPGRPH